MDFNHLRVLCSAIQAVENISPDVHPAVHESIEEFRMAVTNLPSKREHVIRTHKAMIHALLSRGFFVDQQKQKEQVRSSSRDDDMTSESSQSATEDNDNTNNSLLDAKTASDEKTEEKVDDDDDEDARFAAFVEAHPDLNLETSMTTQRKSSCLSSSDPLVEESSPPLRNEIAGADEDRYNYRRGMNCSTSTSSGRAPPLPLLWDSSSSATERTQTLRNMQQVLPGLFLGSLASAGDRTLLLQHSVTHICCCLAVEPACPNDFTYLTLPASDNPQFDLSQFFNSSFDFIENALGNGGRVLVHCVSGISRAPTIVAAYMIRKLKMKASDAIHHIKCTRHCVSPNKGFRLQLEEWEQACRAAGV